MHTHGRKANSSYRKHGAVLVALCTCHLVGCGCQLLHLVRLRRHVKRRPELEPKYNLEFNQKKSIIQFNWSHSTSIPGVTFNVVTLKMDGKMEIAEFMRLQTVLKKEKVRFGIVRRATQQTFLKKYKSYLHLHRC